MVRNEAAVNVAFACARARGELRAAGGERPVDWVNFANRRVWRYGEWWEAGEGRVKPVWAGDIVIETAACGKCLRAVYVVVPKPKGGTRESPGILVNCKFARSRDGLRITLPDGSTVTRPDPTLTE